MSVRSTFRRIPVVGQLEPSTYVVYVGFLLIFAAFAVLLRDQGFLTVSNRDLVKKLIIHLTEALQLVSKHCSEQVKYDDKTCSGAHDTIFPIIQRYPRSVLLSGDTWEIGGFMAIYVRS